MKVSKNVSTRGHTNESFTLIIEQIELCEFPSDLVCQTGKNLVCQTGKNLVCFSMNDVIFGNSYENRGT